MTLEPLVWGDAAPALGGTQAPELATDALAAFLSDAPDLQRRLARIPLADRVAALGRVGDLWKRQYESGALAPLLDGLAASTGYCRALMDIEAQFVPHLFSTEVLMHNVAASFPCDPSGLHRFTEAAKGEYFRFLPAGPVVIISSGNSLIPPLIPTTLSLLTGNATILKPSRANYAGVRAAYALLHEVAETSEAAALMARALAVTYLAHDSPGLSWLLESAPIGVVNFWGAEPARTLLGARVAANKHHPAYLVNGPLTGCAVVDEASAPQAHKGLALNMTLYDQQLCSSPTTGCFIGSWNGAVAFAKEVGAVLDRLGVAMPLAVPEGAMFSLQNARRMLQFKGCTVLSSKDEGNPWTIVISKEKGMLDEIMTGVPELALHNRRRFLELVVVDTPEGALHHIRALPSRPAFMGIDRVQTVGLALDPSYRDAVTEAIALVGPYRIVPLGDMYMRSACEPYDGVNLAQVFTYTAYRRDTPAGIISL